MSIAHDLGIEAGIVAPQGTPVPVPQDSQDSQECRPLQRIAEARRRQGISLRSAARRLGTSVDQVRRQESPQSDMALSNLYEWQRALAVPIADLLVEVEAPLSAPVLNRARMLRIMKTVRSIAGTTKCVSIQRLATMLEQQLVELMPELQDVSAWPSVGQRRGQDELGRTAERIISNNFVSDGLG